MFRRSLLAVAGVALALDLAAGCGPIVRTGWKIDKVRSHVEQAWLSNRLEYTVYQPSHRVALATLETLKVELTEVEVTDVELTQDDRYNTTAEGKRAKPGEVNIPEDYPAFWMDGLNPSGPVVVNCRTCDLRGKTKDGKKVEASIRLEIMGSDQRTVVSVQVGQSGDAKAPKDLIDKISKRVQEPSTRPGSPEERAALNAAFAPSFEDGRKFLVDGEVRIEKHGSTLEPAR